MTGMIWYVLAKLAAIPAVASWLIRRAQRTPYFHLPGYMERWWLLNPYDTETRVARHSWFPWSVRVHHILREDLDMHLHDHPWSARTIILRGWYVEKRIAESTLKEPNWHKNITRIDSRIAGDTATIEFGEFHRITTVPEGGVWTLFITSRYRGTWGFLVDGVKVPWREYLKPREDSK